MTNSNKNYKNIVINSLPEREMEIVGAISAEKMSVCRDKAIQKIKKEIEIQGFRKGNAPDALVVQKVGEMAILEESAEMALTEEYPNILDEHKIDAIGRPEISITKIGLGSDLEFKIKTALMPDVKLSDYKKTAVDFFPGKTSGEIDVTEKEVDDVIENIRQNIAHEKVHKEASGGEKHDHRKIEDSDLPEVNDDFIKTLGNFKDVSDFRSKIKENILSEKKIKLKDKNRVDILEKIMKDSKIDLPKIIVDGELEKMLAQFTDDIGKSGVSLEDYLKHIKKTVEDLRLEWKETAVKRAKSQVILNSIAREEKIEAKEEDIKREIEHILTIHKDVDRFRARMYVETFLTNELVFQFLEGQK
ncbi:MAG: trigger factor [Minisyncoccia bacterium]